MRRLAAAILLAAACGAALLADSFTFSADKVQSILAKGKERTILSGKARVKSDRITISADSVEISGKDYNLLVCSGNVEAIDTEKGIHLRSPTLTYDRSLALALLQGPSILEDGENHVVLKADWIQDDGDRGIALAQVNVRILKEGLACRAEYAIYRRDEHVLVLSGAPRVVKGQDEYRATRMTVNTDTEEIRLEGSVSGSVHTAAASSSATPTTAPAGAAAAPPTAGAAVPAGPATGGTAAQVSAPPGAPAPGPTRAGP